MDQSVNAIFKMMEQNGASLAKKAELCRETRPDLIGEIEEFYSLYQSLAERYDHLNEELCKSIPLEFQSQDAEGAADIAMVTPDQKLIGLHKTGHQVASLSSGPPSSDLSVKDGSDSSSSSSSDSESESFNSSGNAYYSLPPNSNHKGLHHKIIELGTNLPRMEGKLQSDSEDNGDRFDVQENGNYGELLGRMMRYEKELRDSNLKLKLSEDEIARLQNELERSDSFMISTETLQGQLESANQNIRMREADLEVERRRTMELKEMVDSANEMECHLKSAQEEIIVLRAKLESKSEECLDLQERFSRLENDLLERDDEAKAWNFALVNAEESFLAEKSHLQSTISTLSERNSMLDARIEDWELRSKSLEGKLSQLQGLQGEISQLRFELGEKSEHVQVLNKQLDTFKFKYDVLVAEKDGMNAKVSTLVADVSSRDNRIGKMEEHLREEQTKNAALIAGSESLQKQEHGLRMRIVELEREVDKLRGEVSAGAEEKREAIRQLCFSLEHYRSGYKELCQAFCQHKRKVL